MVPPWVNACSRGTTEGQMTIRKRPSNAGYARRFVALSRSTLESSIRLLVHTMRRSRPSAEARVRAAALRWWREQGVRFTNTMTQFLYSGAVLSCPFRNGNRHALLTTSAPPKDNGRLASSLGCVCNFRKFSLDTKAWLSHHQVLDPTVTRIRRSCMESTLEESLRDVGYRSVRHELSRVGSWGHCGG